MLRPITPLRALPFVGLCLVATQLRAADDYRFLADIPYKSEAKSDYERERCKLDLYLPKEKSGFATIVWFHGGGLENGDKTGDIAADLGRRFARDGVAVASVNYRLSPRVKYPAYIEDAAAAFAFVHREIEGHGGLQDRIYLSGHSAGGYLTAMVGLDEQYLAPHKLKLDNIAGLMPISGQMITHSTVRAERGIEKTRPLIDAAAPAYHVRKDAPPFLVIAGANDLPTRAEENCYFASAMKAAGHERTTYLEVKGRDHGTIASRLGEPNDEVAAAVFAFLKATAAK